MLDATLAAYEEERNRLSKPHYQVTTQLASFAPPPPEQRLLFETLRKNQAATNQFFGVLTGIVPPQQFFAPDNLFHIVGAGGMAKVMLGRVTGALHRRPQLAPATAVADG